MVLMRADNTEHLQEYPPRPEANAHGGEQSRC